MTTSSKNCQRTRASLHAYRSGGLVPLERTLIDQHLPGCVDCSAELMVQASLEDAAKVGPTPLSDDRKRAILQGVHARSPVAPTRWLATLDPRSWPIHRVWRPALAVALLGLVALGTHHWTRTTQPAMAAVQAGEVSAPEGVRMVALRPTTLRSTGPTTSPEIEVGAGFLVIEYNRRPGQQPLVVRAPGATIVVRGTIFSVDSDGVRTTVAVKRGRVDVSGRQGPARSVDAGRIVTVQTRASEPAPIDEAYGALLESAIPSHGHGDETKPPAAIARPPEATLSPSQAVPAADDVPAAAPEPAVEPASRRRRVQRGHRAAPRAAPTRSLDPRVSLADARRALRKGDHAGARARLEVLLDGSDTPSDIRDDALYHLAQVFRSTGRYQRAVDTYARITPSTSAGRLARIEQARLYAGRLGQSEKALGVLRGLAEQGDHDPVIEEAWFEMCFRLTKMGRHEASDRCYDQMLARYPKTHRRSTIERYRASRQAGAGAH